MFARIYGARTPSRSYVRRFPNTLTRGALPGQTVPCKTVALGHRLDVRRLIPVSSRPLPERGAAHGVTSTGERRLIPRARRHSGSICRQVLLGDGEAPLPRVGATRQPPTLFGASPNTRVTAQTSSPGRSHLRARADSQPLETSVNKPDSDGLQNAAMRMKWRRCRSKSI